MKGPLYKFTLDDKTHKIIRQKITNYREAKYKGYSYTLNSKIFYFDDSDVDKFKSSRVYSFDPDICHAKEIMLSTIGQRIAKSLENVERWKVLSSKIEGTNT